MKPEFKTSGTVQTKSGTTIIGSFVLDRLPWEFELYVFLVGGSPTRLWLTWISTTCCAGAKVTRVKWKNWLSQQKDIVTGVLHKHVRFWGTDATCKQPTQPLNSWTTKAGKRLVSQHSWEAPRPQPPARATAAPHHWGWQRPAAAAAHTAMRQELHASIREPRPSQPSPDGFSVRAICKPSFHHHPPHTGTGIFRLLLLCPLRLPMFGSKWWSCRLTYNDV